jgi:D-lactate dehydrogenase
MLHKKAEPVLVHLNCSARRMGFEAKLKQLAAPAPTRWCCRPR